MSSFYKAELSPESVSNLERHRNQIQKDIVGTNRVMAERGNRREREFIIQKTAKDIKAKAVLAKTMLEEDSSCNQGQCSQARMELRSTKS